jgi:hypothetical protein
MNNKKVFKKSFKNRNKNINNCTKISSHPVRRAIFKVKNKNKYWQGCGKKGTLYTVGGNAN